MLFLIISPKMYIFRMIFALKSIFSWNFKLLFQTNKKPVRNTQNFFFRTFEIVQNVLRTNVGSKFQKKSSRAKFLRMPPLTQKSINWIFSVCEQVFRTILNLNNNVRIDRDIQCTIYRNLTGIDFIYVQYTEQISSQHNI